MLNITTKRTRGIPSSQPRAGHLPHRSRPRAFSRRTASTLSQLKLVLITSEGHISGRAGDQRLTLGHSHHVRFLHEDEMNERHHQRIALS
jgi:hypothetical protein